MAAMKWQSTDKKNEEEIQNLYIFGYQCKLFRDDEKAMFIDQGKHLIPWMGDSSLMIDRYDGRGHVYELAPFDSDAVDHHHMMMSDREKAVEKACDEERYLELNKDAVEQQTYEEEEMKRLYEAMGEGYSAVAFNYDQPVEPAVIQLNNKPEGSDDDDDEPYENIPELQVPKGVNLPTTIKMHAIIEKTAAFVAKQGPQMEIVIATKQSNNPQFKFLHYSHELNVYYKHITRMIKKGKYNPRPQEEYKKHRRRSSESHDNHHGYLHPSLGGVTEPESTPVTSENFLLSVTAKLPSGQIANTAYAKLLSNLSKHRPESPSLVTKKERPRDNMPVDAVPPTTQHTDGSTSKQNGSSTTTNQERHNQPPIPGMDTVTLPGSNQPPPPGTVPPEPPPYHHHYPTTRYAAESSTSHLAEHGPYPAPSSSSHYDYYQGYGSHEQPTNPGYNGTVQDEKHGVPASGSTHTADQAGGINTEQHNTTSKVSQTTSEVALPSEHSRPIIDKMAEYVIRNGPEFEMMMRNKNDERFSFLQSWHQDYPYYKYKRKEFEAKVKPQTQSKGQSSSSSSSSGSGSDSDSDAENQGAAKGVSFSIKAKDTEVSTVAPKRSLLGDSDEDENHASSHKSRSNTDPIFTADGTTSLSVAAEKKIASECLKNKLAMAARGKMVQAKEEEKVKAERKKKAAMFAQLIKHTNTSGPSSPGPSASLQAVSSSTSLVSLGGATSRGVSPSAMTVESSRGSSVAKSPAQSMEDPSQPPPVVNDSSSSSSSSPRSPPRSRSRSPSVVITSETIVVEKSPSRTPVRVVANTSKRKSRSRSRDRKRRSSRSRSRTRTSKTSFSSRRSRRSRSRSPKRRKSKSPPLPSAYCVIRRSASPNKKSSMLRRRSSRSPPSHHHKQSRSSKTSRRSRDRSRERSKKSRRSKSPSKSSKSKSAKSSKKNKRDKSQDRKKSKKSKKKPKMIPIPELTPPPQQGNSSESEADNKVAGIQMGDEFSQDISRADTPAGESDNEAILRPSNNLLSKVRAMLKAQREEILKEDGEID